MRVMGCVALLLAVGCAPGGEAEVEGSIGSTAFNEALTVMHGEPFIVLFAQEIECIDLAWVDYGYFDGQQPEEGLDATGVQFAYDGELQAGTSSVYGDSAVAALGLVSSGDSFEQWQARDGTITLDDVSVDRISGSFDISFEEGGVSGSFTSVYCRNLRP